MEGIRTKERGGNEIEIGNKRERGYWKENEDKKRMRREVKGRKKRTAIKYEDEESGKLKSTKWEWEWGRS